MSDYLICRKYKGGRKFHWRVCEEKKKCPHLRKFFNNYFCEFMSGEDKKINRRNHVKK
jgi:hypothetical protein